jgi:hypothetical protein
MVRRVQFNNLKLIPPTWTSKKNSESNAENIDESEYAQQKNGNKCKTTSLASAWGEKLVASVM